IVSFSFANETVVVLGATLSFQLDLALSDAFALEVDRLEFTGANVQELQVRFGEFLTLFAEDVTLDLNPAEGEPIITFGGSPHGGGTGVRLGNNASGTIFDGWGGAAGQFAIGRRGEIFILPEFF